MINLMPANLRKPGAKPIVRATVAWSLLAALVAVFLVHTVIPAAGQLTDGFLGYYVGAETIKNGEPGARLYDDEWFRARVKEVSADQVTDIYLVNSPVLAVAWLPLAYLPAEEARRLWVGLSVLWLAFAIGLVARQLVSSQQLLGIVGITALFTLPAPAREQFYSGQMYSFLLLLHVIGWRAYSRRQDATAGIALGLAIALKFSGWPIGLLMIARRRWTAVLWSTVAGVGAAIITLPWVGIDAWRTLLFIAMPRVLQWPAAALTAYQDTTGFWQHWLRYDAQLNPNPIIDAPALACFLTIGTAAAACFALAARQRPAYVSFAAAVALIELLSPVALQYHYMLLLLPLAVLWHEAWLFRSSGALCLALAATVLMGWPVNYKAPHPGWAVLLSYPRLFGGWIVFIALLIAWRDRNPVTAAQPNRR
jgi:hypothetical protein